MDKLAEVAEQIVALNPLQASFLAEVVSALSGDERADLEAYLAFCEGRGLDASYLASSYDLITKDLFREQVFFRRHGRYRYSRYDEVAQSVYMNDEYMAKYMVGLAITSFLWPHHAKTRRFFLDVLPRTRRGRYLEIGPGHGFFFMSALRASSFDSYEGVDISPTSVRLTRELLASGTFGTFDRYRVTECDFFKASFEHPFDMIVMGEVLEHVEDPGAFLRRIRELAQPSADIFITTCMNAPALDHITLFRNVGEVEGLVAEAGLVVRERLVLPSHGVSLETCERDALPVNVAFLLGRSAAC